METKPKPLPFSWQFRWKFWRALLLLVVGLVTAYALFCAEEDFRGKHAWESYKAEMEAKGEVLDFTKFVPPPVPDDQNFAATPLFARLFDFIPGTQKPHESNVWAQSIKLSEEVLPLDAHEALSDGAWRSAKSLDLVELANALLITNRHMHEPAPFKSGQTQEAVQTITNKIQPTTGIIEELRKASERPYSRFNVDYDWEPKYAIILPHLAIVHESCLVLELRSCTELRMGDTGAAFQDVNLMFHLVQSLRTEPILISQAVRCRCLNEMLQPVWEGLKQRQWSDKQLAEIIEELRSLDFMGDAIRTLGAEQCFSDTFFARLRRSWNPIQEVVDTILVFNNAAAQDVRAYILGALAPSGWYYFEQLNYHRLFDYESADVIKTNRIDPDLANQRQEEVVGKAYSDASLMLRHRFLAKVLLPALVPIEAKMTRAQTSANLGFIACALERYRMEHGQFPEDLAALVPKYLDAVPNDLIMDQPLKYRRSDDGTFILYSVGWNKKDDGGVAGKDSRDTYAYEKGNKFTSEGDWVWKYPTASVSR